MDGWPQDVLDCVYSILDNSLVAVYWEGRNILNIWLQANGSLEGVSVLSSGFARPPPLLQPLFIVSLHVPTFATVQC